MRFIISFAYICITMSLNKEAYIRYKTIDECLNDKFSLYPTIYDLIEACEKKLGKNFSISSIQKDIKAMKEDEALGFNAPIKFSRQYNGYYYSDPDFSINSIPLNSAELEALEAVSDVLTAFTGSRISEYYNQAVQKITASIKEKTLHKGKNRKFIQTDAQVRHKGFEYFELLLHAVMEKIPVCFIHYSYNKRCFNSVIAHPVLLKEFQNKWYLVAYSEQHKCLRTFGLDRISDPLMLKKEFHDTSDEIIDNYFSDIYGVYPLPKAVKQKITFLAGPFIAEYIKANPIHTSQTIQKTGEHGGVFFELELIPSQELINFFVQFGPDLVVLSPELVHNKVLETVKKSLLNCTFHANIESSI